MSKWIVAIALCGCTPGANAPALANRGEPEYVELAWHARMDDRDWVHVTLVVDGAPFEVGVGAGPDDEGSGPEGCKSEPDETNPAIQMFRCGIAARWYSAALDAGEVVVTRFDEWLDPHRLTTTVVRRVKVRGKKLLVAADR